MPITMPGPASLWTALCNLTLPRQHRNAEAAPQSTSAAPMATAGPSLDRVQVKREIDEARAQADTVAENQRRRRVKQELSEQRSQDAEDGLVVTESINVTDEPAVARHLPSSWDTSSAAQRHAWFYDWHQEHPGQRMCPSCHAQWDVKYVLKHTRSGRAQFTCNHMTCTNCWTGLCLSCGRVKGGGHSSGYHVACGRQPTWLQALEDELHLQNDDPRVQRPPPLLHPRLAATLERGASPTSAGASASRGVDTHQDMEPVQWHREELPRRSEAYWLRFSTVTQTGTAGRERRSPAPAEKLGPG